MEIRSESLKKFGKSWIFAEFWILPGISGLQSEFAGLVLVLSISRWRRKLFIRMFSFSFLSN